MTSKKWKKTNEPLLCYLCGQTACAEADIGNGIHWYCFRCIADNTDLTEEYEVGEHLQVCHEQLGIQSEAYQ